MPIDLTAVDWIYVGVLSVFVFLAAFLANLISLYNRGVAAVLSAIIFAGLFVGWTYYPHGLPLPTRLTTVSPMTAPLTPPPPSPTPATPQRPRNPVTDITPGPVR